MQVFGLKVQVRFILLYTSTLEIALHNFAFSSLRSAISKSHKLVCVIYKLSKLGCAISKLGCNFTISNLRNAISKLSKFANCAEHIHIAVPYYVNIQWKQ